MHDEDSHRRRKYLSSELRYKHWPEIHQSNICDHGRTTEAARHRSDSEYRGQIKKATIVKDDRKRPRHAKHNKPKYKASDNANREGCIQMSFFDAFKAYQGLK